MSSLNIAVAAFVALLPITNPVGAVPVFAGMTGGGSKQEVHRTAIRTGLYVAAILAVFALVGPLLLTALGITIAALQIAGGLVVAHSGYSMLVPAPRLSTEEQAHAETKRDISFSPMALPLIAGPGAIGVVIALGARNPHLLDRLGIALAAVAIGLVIGLALRFGTPLVDKLGPTGIGALTRVMGFLILTIGVELLVHGVQAALK